MEKKYSIFNNFNKNFKYSEKDNYFRDYVEEFSEEIFNRSDSELTDYLDKEGISKAEKPNEKR